MKRTVRRALVALLFLLAALLATMYVLAGASPSPDSAVDRAQLLGAGVTVLAALGSLLAWASRRRRENPDPESALVQAVLRKWSHEAVVRELTHPLPARVSWAISSRRGASRAAVIGGEEQWAEEPLRGELGATPDAARKFFQALPSRQLVILGEPGAGKSSLALLLTLELARGYDRDEKIPLLISMNKWMPGVAIGDFVSNELATQHNPVLSRYGNTSAIARGLVSRGRILPVFDGLDEIPERALEPALSQLDIFASAGNPLVVTSRIREYERASSEGSVISRAAVVELEPLSTDAVVDFLCQPFRPPQWEPVLEHLQLVPAGPLARTLASPLMLALARTAYRDNRSHPEDLLKYPSSNQVRRALLDAYLGSLYSEQSPERRRAPLRRLLRPGGRRRAKARRWLEAIALEMHLQGALDLDWQKVRPYLPPVGRARGWMLAAALSSSIGIVAFTAIWFVLRFGTDALRWVFAVGIVYSIAIIVAPRSGIGSESAQSHPRGRKHGQFTVFGYSAFLTAVAGGAAAVVSLSPTRAVIAGMIAACPIGIFQALVAPRVLDRSRRRNTSTTQLTHTFLAGAIWAGLLIAVWLMLFGRSPEEVGAAIRAGLLLAFAAAAMSGVYQNLRFAVARVILALTGDLPWCFWAFIRDGHARGVFRVSGVHYQFRHSFLQYQLAQSAELKQLLSDPSANTAAQRNVLAGALAAQYRSDQALDVWRELANEGSIEARRRLAWISATRGDFDEILDLYRTAVGRPGASRDALSALLRAYGRWHDEVSLWAGLGATGDADARFRLAQALYLAGRTSEALEQWKAQDPAAHPTVRRAMAEALLDLGDVSAAERVLMRSDGRSTPTDLAQQACLTLLDHNLAAAALRLARETGAFSPHRDLKSFCMRLVDDGRAGDAVALVYERRSTLGVDDFDSVWLETELLLAIGQYETALSAVASPEAGPEGRGGLVVDLVLARRDGPGVSGHPPGYREVVSVLVNHLSASLDKKHLAGALADSFEQPPARELATLAQWVHRVAQGKEAEDELRGLARKGSWPATEALAWLLAAGDRHAEASALLGLPLRRSSRTPFETAARLLMRTGAVKAANAVLSILEVDSTSRRASLAEILILSGDSSRAVSLLEVDARRGSFAAFARISGLLTADGRSADAIRIARDIASRDSRMRSWLSDLLFSDGRIEEAVAVWRPTADIGDIDAVERVAELFAADGRVDDAVDMWQPFVEIGEPRAIRSAARLLERGGRSGEALQMWYRLATRGHVASRLDISSTLVHENRVSEALASLHPDLLDGVRAVRDGVDRMFTESGEVRQLRDLWATLATDGDIDARARLRRLNEVLENGGPGTGSP